VTGSKGQGTERLLCPRTPASPGPNQYIINIQGTGTGAIVGTWFVDGTPVETFQSSMLAGIAMEVSTRLTLPTLDLGEHEVQLQLMKPSPMVSNSRRYVVVPADSATQRVFLTSPRSEAALAPDEARLSYKWLPMPGASGYEIAFASGLAALGLDENGNVLQGNLGHLAWSKESSQLALFASLPGNTIVWKPTSEEYAQLFGRSQGLYWAVRAIYPGQNHGDPTTTARPRQVVLMPAQSKLALSAPLNSVSLSSPFPTFEWEAGPAGCVYQITLMSGDRAVFSAMTEGTQYTLDDLMTFQLKPGAYAWRVVALKPGEGIVASSETRNFTVTTGSAGIIAPTIVRAANAATRVAVRGFILLPNVVPGIAFTPADASKVTEQQPAISVTYPEALPGKVRLILDGVDVTGLSQVSQTSLSFTSPRPLAEGEHTLDLILITIKNEKLQTSSKFTVEAASGKTPATTTPEAPDTEADQASLPMKLQVDSRWQGGTGQTAGDALNIDSNLRGEGKWGIGNGSYGAANFQVSRPSGQDINMTSFLAQAGFGGDRYKARLGDVGGSESPFTVNGITSRAFNFVSDSGPVRFSATHTLGDVIGKSSAGRAPELLLITAEGAKSTTERGLKMIFVNSKDDVGSGGFTGPSNTSVLSLTGRTPLGKTGFALQGELARSTGTFETLLGTHSANDTAMSAGVGGKVQGFDVSLSYRSIGADFTSPASNTLSSDLRGWDVKASRPIGKFITSTLSYITLANTCGELTPDSTVTSQSVDMAFNYPNLPMFTFRLAKNKADSDPATPGALPTSNEENVWSITANYAKSKWNTYLTYSRADFADAFDALQLQQNPQTYTPNARNTGTWSAGAGYQVSSLLSFRLDIGSNNTDRFFRQLMTNELLEGTDGANQFRFETEYRPSDRLSATMAWSRSKSETAIGLFSTEQSNLDLRLNYYLTHSGANGRFALTAAFRHTDAQGTIPGDLSNVFSIMLNDSRLFNLSL
jgi:hypothetical protein